MASLALVGLAWNKDWPPYVVKTSLDHLGLQLGPVFISFFLGVNQSSLQYGNANVIHVEMQICKTMKDQ